MLRHVVVFTWRPEATEEQKQKVADELAKLPGVVESLRDYRFGPDAGIAEGNYDFAVVADVDDADGFRAYIDHPAHQEVLVNHIRPILDQRAAVQFQL